MNNMNKRILSFIIILAMVFSIVPSFKIQSVALANGTVQNTLSVAIQEMKNYYIDEKAEYNYLEAMTLNSLDVDNETIQNKLNIDELSFEVGSSWQDSSSKEYAKAIMGLIAAGFDPKNYNGKDYISFLTSSQTEEGYFETKKDSGDKADDIAYSILALDMAGAEYDVVKAVNVLNSKITIEGDNAFVKEWSFLSSGDLELTAISIMALSNHEDIIDTNLIDKAINFIDSERLKCGMYGDIEWTGKEKVSGKLTSKMVQALIAVGEDIISERWSITDENGNKTTMIDGILELKSGNEFKDSTSEAFAALTDVYTGKSMFKTTDIKEASRVEIVLPEDRNSIKVGKKMQVSAKVYDIDEKIIPSQELIWSSDNNNIATIDEKGIVTAILPGTTTINVQVKGSDIKNSVKIHVVDVEPNSIDIRVHEDVTQIEVGNKTLIYTDVLDVDSEKVENPQIKWEISPIDLASIDDEGILTALKPGNVTITASVQKSENVISKSIDLRIITRQQRINEALEEVKDGIIANPDKYEYTTAMGLRLTGTNVDDIAEKAAKYSYWPNTNTRSKDIMMAIAIGKDPKDYHDKNYVQEILDSDFYNEENPEWLANGIIALDMADAEYDEVKAVSALIGKLEKNVGKYYIINKNNNNPNTEITALTLISLSKHRDIDGVNTAIEGIKNYLKSIQDDKAFIENCKNHSLAIQALIASGEDIYSDEWTKQDEFGNKITLLDGLLSLKVGSEFKVRPDNPYVKSGQEVYAFASLVDLSTNKSMYHEISYTGPKDYSIKIETDLKDLTLNQGDTLKLEAKVFENGDPVNKEVIWESLDSSIVQVKDGEIKALKEGQTKVIAKIKFFEDIYDEVNITVDKIIGKAEKIVIKKTDNVTLIKGDRFKLEADVLDGNGNILENNEFEWTSSNSNIASVDENGNVVAHGVGSVEISVKIKNTHIKDTITIVIFDNEKDANNTVGAFIESVKDYYENAYYRESQGNLDAWETATFVRANINLDKWYANKKYQPAYDMNLKYFASKVNQALIMLDIGENPTDFEGRNLIVEIIEELNKVDYGHANQNYLMGVIAIDRYNEKYKDETITYDEDIVMENILKAQTEDGGFTERGGNSVPLNTAYALQALSKHRDYTSINESIEKALDYLHSIQKDDGGFYTTTYITGYNAKIISGLLAVGEDLTSEIWTKGNSNPIESLFILWKDNKSFDNKEGESKNNRGWVAATQKAFYTLVDLKEAGYSNYVVKTARISDNPEEPEEVLDVYTAIVVDMGKKYDIKSDPKKVTINTKTHDGGLTVLGALQATTSLYTVEGGFVTEIFGIQNKGMGGWVYTINDKLPDVNADKALVKSGDRIVWFYSSKGMDAKIPIWSELDEYPITINDIKKTESEGKVIFEVSISNTSQVQNALVILKPIDENGRPYKVKYETLSEGQNNVKFELDSSDYPKGLIKVKVYIWDSFEGMKPLAEVKEKVF